MLVCVLMVNFFIPHQHSAGGRADPGGEYQLLGIMGACVPPNPPPPPAKEGVAPMGLLRGEGAGACPG